MAKETIIRWTFGNGEYSVNTKEEARKIRKEEFGDLYASEAEMDRLLPLYKAEFGVCGLEGFVMIGRAE